MQRWLYSKWRRWPTRGWYWHSRENSEDFRMTFSPLEWLAIQKHFWRGGESEVGNPFNSPIETEYVQGPSWVPVGCMGWRRRKIREDGKWNGVFWKKVWLAGWLAGILYRSTWCCKILCRDWLNTEELFKIIFKAMGALFVLAMEAEGCLWLPVTSAHSIHGRGDGSHTFFCILYEWMACRQLFASSITCKGTVGTNSLVKVLSYLDRKKHLYIKGPYWYCGFPD